MTLYIIETWRKNNFVTDKEQISALQQVTVTGDNFLPLADEAYRQVHAALAALAGLDSKNAWACYRAVYDEDAGRAEWRFRTFRVNDLYTVTVRRMGDEVRNNG